MSEFDLITRLSGALSIVGIAKALVPRVVKAGHLAQADADKISRELNRLAPLIDQQVMHTPEELNQIGEKMTLVIQLIDLHSGLLTAGEKQLFEDGMDRVSGKFLKKIRKK